MVEWELLRRDKADVLVEVVQAYVQPLQCAAENPTVSTVRIGVDGEERGAGQVHVTQVSHLERGELSLNLVGERATGTQVLDVSQQVLDPNFLGFLCSDFTRQVLERLGGWRSILIAPK